jgi:small subunit ribosomal protein S20
LRFEYYGIATIIEEEHGMPQHKSAKKRVKTNLRRQLRNRAGRSALRRELRRYRELSSEDRPAAYAHIQSVLDRAADKGFIPRNRAARLKSRLAP